MSQRFKRSGPATINHPTETHSYPELKKESTSSGLVEFCNAVFTLIMKFHNIVLLLAVLAFVSTVETIRTRKRCML